MTLREIIFRIFDGIIGKNNIEYANLMMNYNFNQSTKSPLLRYCFKYFRAFFFKLLIRLSITTGSGLNSIFVVLEFPSDVWLGLCIFTFLQM